MLYTLINCAKCIFLKFLLLVTKLFFFPFLLVFVFCFFGFFCFVFFSLFCLDPDPSFSVRFFPRARGQTCGKRVQSGLLME